MPKKRKPKTCSKCGKTDGHTAPTCPLNKENKTSIISSEPKKRKERTCKNCGGLNHDSRNCTKDISATIESKPSKQKEIGRQILAEQRKKIDRLEDEEGNIPQKGLWLINKEKRKIAGKIIHIKRSGMIVWEDALGTIIKTEQDKILRNGYHYEDLSPQHLNWNIQGTI